MELCSVINVPCIIDLLSCTISIGILWKLLPGWNMLKFYWYFRVLVVHTQGQFSGCFKLIRGKKCFSTHPIIYATGSETKSSGCFTSFKERLFTSTCAESCWNFVQFPSAFSTPLVVYVGVDECVCVCVWAGLLVYRYGYCNSVNLIYLKTKTYYNN